jgi:hypothetical protein
MWKRPLLLADVVTTHGSRRRWPEPASYSVLEGPTEVQAIDDAIVGSQGWAPLIFQVRSQQIDTTVESQLTHLNVHFFRSEICVTDLIGMPRIRRNLAGFIVPDAPPPTDPSMEPIIGLYVEVTALQDLVGRSVEGWRMFNVYPVHLTVSGTKMITTPLRSKSPSPRPDR